MPSCSKRGCNQVGTVRQSRTNLYCGRCYRITKMIEGANRRYPLLARLSWEDGDNLFKSVEPDMKCPHCQRTMTLHSSIAGRAAVASIQHYDDGRLGIICNSCNGHHGACELGDELFTEVQNHSRYCPGCKEIKLNAQFPHSWDRPDGLYSYCRSCTAIRKRNYKTRMKGIQLADSF